MLMISEIPSEGFRFLAAGPAAGGEEVGAAAASVAASVDVAAPTMEGHDPPERFRFLAVEPAPDAPDEEGSTAGEGLTFVSFFRSSSSSFSFSSFRVCGQN